MNEYFKIYLQKYYLPAQRWALSKEGKQWIKCNVPSMEKYMDTEYDKKNKAIYLIKFNDISVYCGESIKAVNRLCVHLYNIFKNGYEYFGVYEDEIHKKEVIIKVEILADSIDKKEERKQIELKYIDKYEPILQTLTKGSDRCIRKNRRRNRIEECVLNKV